MDMQEARIRVILGKQCKPSPESAQRYYQYLQKALALPCRLTGREDFPWEASCLAAGWESDAYQEMKKEHPSFLDQFELLELLPPPKDGLQIVARVQRTSDRKAFEIQFSLLECIDFKDHNYQLLDDYAHWSVDT